MKAYIFDLDGTLADTLESLWYSVNLTLEEMGLPPIAREECRRFVGNGARALLEKSLAAAGDRKPLRIEEGMRRYGRIFEENCTYHVVPYKGITKLLGELKDRGGGLAVLSNKPHRQAVKTTEKVFGSGVFDWVQGEGEGIPRKPSPEGIFRILEKLGAKKEETLYVGDSEVDIAAAKAAAVRYAVVDWGFRSREALRAAGAERIIASPEEILDFV